MAAYVRHTACAARPQPVTVPPPMTPATFATTHPAPPGACDPAREGDRRPDRDRGDAGGHREQALVAPADRPMDAVRLGRHVRPQGPPAENSSPTPRGQDEHRTPGELDHVLGGRADRHPPVDRARLRADHDEIGLPRGRADHQAAEARPDRLGGLARAGIAVLADGGDRSHPITVVLGETGGRDPEGDRTAVEQAPGRTPVDRRAPAPCGTPSRRRSRRRPRRARGRAAPRASRR